MINDHLNLIKRLPWVPLSWGSCPHTPCRKPSPPSHGLSGHQGELWVLSLKKVFSFICMWQAAGRGYSNWSFSLWEIDSAEGNHVTGFPRLCQNLHSPWGSQTQGLFSLRACTSPVPFRLTPCVFGVGKPRASFLKKTEATMPFLLETALLWT